MVYTQTYVRESHTSHILGYGHTVAALGVGGVFYGYGQVAVNHIDGFDFKHIAQFPGTLGD